MKFINIGFGNMISVHRIIAVVSPDSAPIKRIVSNVRNKNNLIDATCGRKTRAVIVMDSEHIILSALQPETISNRLKNHCISEEEYLEEFDDNKSL